MYGLGLHSWYVADNSKHRNCGFWSMGVWCLEPRTKLTPGFGPEPRMGLQPDWAGCVLMYVQYILYTVVEASSSCTLSSATTQIYLLFHLLFSLLQLDKTPLHGRSLKYWEPAEPPGVPIEQKPAIASDRTSSGTSPCAANRPGSPVLPTHYTVNLQACLHQAVSGYDTRSSR